MSEEQRTIPQNKAMHKYFELLAEALNNAGYDMEYVLQFKAMDVPWTKDLVKEALWKEAQKALFNKLSSSELDTKQVSEVYDVLDRWTGANLGIHVPFPSIESESMEALGVKK